MPANADERPPQFERWAARSAPHVTNPLPATIANLMGGIKLYAKTMDHLPPAAQKAWQQVRAST
jgi:hypothetical protein